MLLYKKCPHCRRKIRCKDLAGMKERVQVCRHCKKQYELHKGYRVIPVVTACILMICFNLLMFHMSKDMNKTTFIIMVIADAAVILLSLLISPLFIKLTKYRHK